MSEFSERMKRKLRGAEPSWALRRSNRINTTSGSERSYQYKVQSLPSLSPHQRGAVWPLFPIDAFIGRDGIEIKPFSIDHEALRTTLLFFDVVDIPLQNAIGGIKWCEDQFRSIGALSQSVFQIEGAVEPAIQDLPFAAFLEHDKAEPGRWSLSRPAQSLGVPKQALSGATGFALTLQNALPIFTREVPLAEVAEFKERRFDELLALRAHLDDLCIAIARNGTGGLAETVAFERFDLSLAEYVKAMNQSNRQKIWTSLKASVDPTVAIPAGFEALLNHTITAGSLVGALATIGIKTASGLRHKRKASNPYEYLTSAHLEL